MKLNALKYFIEVAETRSFTKASERLFVSQPGISQQIDSLEKQLGVMLLLRTTRNVELTEEGRYLYEKIHSAFNEIERTVSNLVEATTFPGLINIATIPSAASLYIPSLVRGMKNTGTEIEFLIEEMPSSETIDSIHNGSSHLGFIRTTKNFTITNKHELDYIAFNGSPIKAIVSTKHPLANRDTIHLKELSKEYFIQHNQSQSNALFTQLEDLCAAAGFTPKILLSGPELLTTSTIVSNNLAVALMPENICAILPHKDIKVIGLEDMYIENSITAIWKDDGYISPNLALLIRALQEMKDVEDNSISIH